MTVDDIKEIINTNLKDFKNKTMTNLWEIRIKYTHEGFNGDDAYSELYPEYKQTTITFNIDAFREANEDDIKNTLRHELLHLHLADIDNLFHSILDHLDESVSKSYIDWYKTEIERSIWNIETMLDWGYEIQNSREI